MNIALILSGGIGTRIGMDIPKQYIEVNQKPIIAYVLEQLSMHKNIDWIQIVADEAWQNRILDILKNYDVCHKFLGFSKPGENRQMSILHGLRDIRNYLTGKKAIAEHNKFLCDCLTSTGSCILEGDGDFHQGKLDKLATRRGGNSERQDKPPFQDDVVLIHDAVRPCLSQKLISDCLEAIQGHDGVLPVLPCKDTMYASADGKGITSLLPRNEIFFGQAPEAFLLEKYYEANRRLLPNEILKINGSTEVAILAGLDVVLIKGEEQNFKITTREDLERFRQICGV